MPGHPRWPGLCCSKLWLGRISLKREHSEGKSPEGPSPFLKCPLGSQHSQWRADCPCSQVNSTHVSHRSPGHPIPCSKLFLCSPITVSITGYSPNLLHTGPQTMRRILAHTHTGSLVPGSLTFPSDLPPEQGFWEQMKKTMPRTMPSTPRPKATPHSAFSRRSEGRAFWGTRAERVRSSWRTNWGALHARDLGVRDNEGELDHGSLKLAIVDTRLKEPKENERAPPTGLGLFSPRRTGLPRKRASPQ